MRNGELDSLPGAGAPLAFDGDLLVPEEVRVHRVLKNAGYVPPEVEARRELHEASAVIKELDPASQEYLRALQKLRYLDVRLAEQRGFGLRAEPDYFRRLLQRLGGE